MVLKGFIKILFDISNREKPHVVFLQELIEPAEDIIGEKCPTYHCIPAHDENYYAAMLLKTGFVEVEESIVMPFPSSIMGRNVLSVKVSQAFS